MADITKEILISEKEFTDTNHERTELYRLDSDGNIYLTVNSLIKINKNYWFK